MLNYSFYKTRIHIALALLFSLSFSKIINIFRNLSAYYFKYKRNGLSPSILTIHLTYKCNYTCIMCQKSSSDKNMYTHNLIEIDFEKLEKLLRNNARTIAILRITGGEPFLYSDFEKLIDLLNEINLKYSILTNGSLIDDKIAQKTADRLGITIRWNSQILYFSKEENQIISNRNPVVGCIDFFFSGIITPDFKFKICPLSNPISDLKDGDLQRLWNGVEINEGRKMIQKNNFPSTCRYCPDYNEHFNETGKEYSFIDYQKRTHYWKL